MQTDLSRATWSLCTLSKLEHTIFRRRYRPYTYYMHFVLNLLLVTKFREIITCLYLKFRLNDSPRTALKVLKAFSEIVNKTMSAQLEE